MGPRMKMVIGGLLVVLGVWWYIPMGTLNTLLLPFSTLSNAKSLIVLAQGGVGIFAILVGAFILWIEMDELRMRRELEERNLEAQMETEDDTDGDEEPDDA